MKITKDEVQHIAKLAKIRFTDDETTQMTKELDSILTHFEAMDRIDFPEEELKVEEINTVLRRDKAVIFPDQNKLFRNTKEMREGYIQVPKIIEG